MIPFPCYGPHGDHAQKADSGMRDTSMYSILEEQNNRPRPFSAYTAEDLWTDPHVAGQMLAYHLDPDQDLASRNHAFIERSVRWLENTFALGEGKRVLDLGCGPGLYANALASCGASVTGVDFSRNSLGHARSVAESQGLDVTYHAGNYLTLDLEGSFDIVLLIFGDFCPLGPDHRRNLLDRVKGWLAPGGRFVFDVSTHALYNGLEEFASYEAVPNGGFWSAEPHFVFSNRFKYPEEMAFLDRHLVVGANGRRELFNWIQCYDPKSLAVEMNAAGWEVESTPGNLAGDPLEPEADFFGVVARPK